jgi:hypothetical protein
MYERRWGGAGEWEWVKSMKCMCKMCENDQLGQIECPSAVPRPHPNHSQQLWLAALHSFLLSLTLPHLNFTL